MAIPDKNWLLKPENYRLIQSIRKRVRSEFGEDIRISGISDVIKLLAYENKTRDPQLTRAFEKLKPIFEEFEPQEFKVYRGKVMAVEAKPSEAIDPANLPKKTRTYRGQVVPA